MHSRWNSVYARCRFGSPPPSADTPLAFFSPLHDPASAPSPYRPEDRRPAAFRYPSSLHVPYFPSLPPIPSGFLPPAHPRLLPMVSETSVLVTTTPSLQISQTFHAPGISRSSPFPHVSRLLFPPSRSIFPLPVRPISPDGGGPSVDGAEGRDWIEAVDCTGSHIGSAGSTK
jgi:hypothetical protein